MKRGRPATAAGCRFARAGLNGETVPCAFQSPENHSLPPASYTAADFVILDLAWKQ